MEQFKRAQVIMLPTENKTNDNIVKDGNKLEIVYNNSHQHEDYIPQHLYIISDDEIKVNEYGYHSLDKKPIKITKELLDGDIRRFGYKKIIATTDKSLIIDTEIFGKNRYKEIPQPSQQFIIKYIEEYNKSNIITDVLVEYDYCPNRRNKGDLSKCPKINSKDNTITIKKLKDSWNREELIELLEKSYIQGRNDGHCTFRVEELGFNNWIKENL